MREDDGERQYLRHGEIIRRHSLEKIFRGGGPFTSNGGGIDILAETFPPIPALLLQFPDSAKSWIIEAVRTFPTVIDKTVQTSTAGVCRRLATLGPHGHRWSSSWERRQFSWKSSPRFGRSRIRWSFVKSVRTGLPGLASGALRIWSAEPRHVQTALANTAIVDHTIVTKAALVLTISARCLSSRQLCQVRRNLIGLIEGSVLNRWKRSVIGIGSRTDTSIGGNDIGTSSASGSRRGAGRSISGSRGSSLGGRNWRINHSHLDMVQLPLGGKTILSSKGPASRPYSDGFFRRRQVLLTNSCDCI